MKTPPSQKRNNCDVARGKLRGALNDSLQGQEVDDIPEDYDEEEEEEPQQIVQHKQRGRPKKIQPQQQSPQHRVHSLSPMSFLTPSKRRKLAPGNNHSHKIQAESFVMKLFDRSLDLSKYTEQTSLYPICRAWMSNQPRNPSIRNYRDARSPSPIERKDNAGEILTQLQKGHLRDVTTMPRLKTADIPKIPSPQDEPKIYDYSEELVKPDDVLKDGKKEDILAQHLNNWKQIKQDWQKHTKVYHHRSEVNFHILQELFKP